MTSCRYRLHLLETDPQALEEAFDRPHLFATNTDQYLQTLLVVSNLTSHERLMCFDIGFHVKLSNFGANNMSMKTEISKN